MVRLWETSTGRLLTTLRGHIGMVRDVALSADGRWVASGGAADGTLRLWEASTGHPVATLQAHAAGVWGVALSLDGLLIATGGADGRVRLWQAGSGRPLASFQAPNGEVLGVGLSADGRLLAAGGADGMLRLWEPFADNAPARTLQAERRYARTNISGLTGITDAQRATLLALGAIEQTQIGRASRPADGAQPTTW
jgi:WD40 repeat protein